MFVFSLVVVTRKLLYQNNQQAEMQIAFWFQSKVWVEGWLCK